MIGKAIVSKLTGDTDVAALVETRVFPEFRPTDAVPAIVYEVDGNEDAGGNPVSCVVRLHLVATTYAQVQDLAAKVRATLNQQSGTWGGVLVQGAFLDDESEDTLTVGDSRNVRYHVLDQSYLIWFVR